MSRTITIDSCCSSKTASPTTSATFIAYPRVSQDIAFATRSGVFRRPWRVGSSPMSSSSRRTMFSNSSRLSWPSGGDASNSSAPAWGRAFSFAASAALILDIVILRLPELELRQPRRRDLRREDPPAGQDEVLGGRDDPLHERHVEVEVLVVHLVHEF